MAHRATPIVLVLPLLAACATTPSVPQHDVVRQRDAVYLDGVTSEYSVRLDELRNVRARDTRLPNAVVAGDQTMTVAASIFRCDDVYTLDMVVQNLSDEPLVLERARVRLFDWEGVELSPLIDWRRGVDYGLRSIQGAQLGYRHLGTDFQAGQADATKRHGKEKPATKTVPSARSAASGTADHNLLETPQDFSWLSELKMEHDSLVLPDAVELPAKQNAPYWAYWKAKEVRYPITAVVVIDGKRLIFRFEEPGAKTAR